MIVVSEGTVITICVHMVATEAKQPELLLSLKKKQL